MAQKANPDPAPTLEAKIAFLLRPESYPDRPSTVQAIETHMSWVFVGSDFAYKLKKPIRRETLDYRTLETRLLNCRREVELNRRLAPDVYIGVVALTFDQDGRLQLGGSGRVVEWLVKMRRLPEERTLRHALLAGRVDDPAIRRVASRLVAFFAESAIVPFEPAAYCLRFERRIHDTHVALRRSAYRLPKDQLDRLARAQLTFLAANAAIFGARARHVIEGHGDLRPEHIYLDDESIITDCLEFDRELRLLDPVDELAFLALECERLGAPGVGTVLFSSYRTATGDAVAPALVDFYACGAAFLRARLASWHLDEPGVRDPDKWRRRAHRYLALAELHSRQM